MRKVLVEKLHTSVIDVRAEDLYGLRAWDVGFIIGLYVPEKFPNKSFTKMRERET